jgi:hypothetical protein
MDRYLRCIVISPNNPILYRDLHYRKHTMCIPTPKRTTRNQSILRGQSLPTSHSIYPHHFIAIVIDDLDRDLACLGFVEWITLGRVECRPRGFVNLSAQRAFQFFVWLVCACKVGVTHKETFAVVVRVGTKYELMRRLFSTSSVIPSSENLKWRRGSEYGELSMGFSITTCFICYP